jgi:hypothetical protein
MPPAPIELFAHRHRKLLEPLYVPALLQAACETSLVAEANSSSALRESSYPVRLPVPVAMFNL